jgi:phage FluMu gp28-like protein
MSFWIGSLLSRTRRRNLFSAQKRLRLAEETFHWTPHETQRIWLLDEHKVKAASCGRRWGKTEAQAIDVATFAMCGKGTRQMIVSPTYDQSRLIFDTVERLLLGCPKTRGFTRCVRTPYPRIEHCGNVIMARTADEDGRNLRGHSADRVIVDEAAYVSDAVVEEVIGPMLADRDGQLIMISTPFGKNHFYRAFVAGEGKSPRHSSFRFPSWRNPHISRDYIEMQREYLTKRQFSVEYEAEFIDDQNSVFCWTDIENAFRSSVAGDDSRVGWRVAGIDWARYSDYTCIVIVETAEKPHRVVAIDRFNRFEWHTQVDRVVEFMEKYRVNEALADQTSVGDPLLEQLRNALCERGSDVNLQGMNFTNAGKREIIDNLSIRLAHRDLTFPYDEQMVRELQYYEYELTTSGNVRMNARPGYTDDLVVALALAAWQAKSAPCAGGSRFLTTRRAEERGW